MPLDIVVGTIAAVSAGISLVFGGGLLKTAMAHSNELAVQKHIQTETTRKVAENDKAIQAIDKKQGLQDRDIEGFKEHVRKLDMLPEINSQLRELHGLMAYLKEQISDFRSERISHDKSHS